MSTFSRTPAIQRQLYLNTAGVYGGPSIWIMMLTNPRLKRIGRALKSVWMPE